MTIFADVCKKSNIALGRVEIVAEAEKPADSPRLSEATVKVKVSTNARKELIETA